MHKKGQHQQFIALAKSNDSYMGRLCAYFFPNDMEQHREMMQAVLVEMVPVVERWEQRHAEPMTAAYFCTVFRNSCLHYYTSHRKHRDKHTLLPLDQLPPTVDEDNASLYPTLYDLIDHLTSEERCVLECYFQSENSTDMAQQMGISPGNARVRLHRIVSKLRTLKAAFDNENYDTSFPK